MITTDVKNARSFVTGEVYEQAYAKALDAFGTVKNGSGVGNEWLGWQRILDEPNDAELERITSNAAKIRNDADIFIVCGIGGSYTGAMAIIEALSPYFKSNGPEILYAGHHMSGKYLKQLMNYLKEPNDNGEPKSIYLNAISKSGSTLETALAFRTSRETFTSINPTRATRSSTRSASAFCATMRSSAALPAGSAIRFITLARPPVATALAGPALPAAS